MTQPPKNLFFLSLKDFFTMSMLKLTFLPFLISLFVMYTLFFAAADYGLDQLKNASVQVETHQSTMQNGQMQSENFQGEFTGSGIIDFLLAHTITSWILSFLIYTVGAMAVLLLSIVVAVIIVGFLTPLVLKILQRRHYNDIEIVGFGNAGTAIWFFLKTFLIMLGLLLVLGPIFIWIPVVGFIAINFPFYYFFHKMITFDVASTLCTREEYAVVRVREGNAIRFKTLLLYALSMVPFVALLGSVFFVIYIGHSYFVALSEIRPADAVAEPVTPDTPKAINS